MLARTTDRAITAPAGRRRCYASDYHVQAACGMSPALSDLPVRKVVRGSIHYLKTFLQFADTEASPTLWAVMGCARLASTIVTRIGT